MRVRQGKWINIWDRGQGTTTEREEIPPGEVRSPVAGACRIVGAQQIAPGGRGA